MPMGQKLFLGFRRLHCAPRLQLFQTLPAAWISSMGAALSWKQVSPGHEAQDLGSFQDDKPRQLPGMKSSDQSAELHYDPTNNTCMQPWPHLSVPLNNPQGSGVLVCTLEPQLTHPWASS